MYRKVLITIAMSTKLYSLKETKPNSLLHVNHLVTKERGMIEKERRKKELFKRMYTNTNEKTNSKALTNIITTLVSSQISPIL